MAKKLRGILFILILGSVSTLTLLGIKNYTYPRISYNERVKFTSAILDAADIGYNEDNLEETFNKNIRVVENTEFIYYLSPSNLYIFEFKGRGLWGPIIGIITLNSDLETIEGIQIIAHEETPGLGGRITEEGFLSQFVKKKLTPRLEIVLRKKSTKNNEVDAISGASMTSAALVDMINDSVENLRKSIGK